MNQANRRFDAAEAANAGNPACQPYRRPRAGASA
jgi:hypothetical protein